MYVHVRLRAVWHAAGQCLLNVSHLPAPSHARSSRTAARLAATLPNLGSTYSAAGVNASVMSRSRVRIDRLGYKLATCPQHCALMHRPPPGAPRLIGRWLRSCIDRRRATVSVATHANGAVDAIARRAFRRLTPRCFELSSISANRSLEPSWCSDLWMRHHDNDA